LRKRMQHVLTAAGMLATAVVAVPVLAGGASAAAAVSPTLTTKPTGPVQNCRLIPFDKAEAYKSDTGQVTLVVTGVAATSGVKVDLVPLVYIRQPEYWGIQVIGCSPQISLPVITPWAVKKDVTATVGTAGLEVIGSNQSVKITLAPSRSDG
jgi:hypothetical protein